MQSLFKIFHTSNGVKKEIKIANNMNIKYQKNIAQIFSFTLYQTDASFLDIQKYSSNLEVINIKENKVIFIGRIISVIKSMDENGVFKASIQAESEMNYLNDILFLEQIEFHPTDVLPPKAIKNSKLNQTVKTFLQFILDYYNSRVDKAKEIKLGNIEDETPIYIKITEQVSILNLLQSKIISRHKGYLQIRTENDIRYLDFLVNNPIKKSLVIDLGVNQKSISIDDNFNFYTRIIPIGKDGIDITSVNNGSNYIQDEVLVNKYGVIEKIMKWEDVTIPQNLFNKAKVAYKSICLGMDNIKLKGLDLSYLNNNFVALELYRPIRAINNILGYDNTHEIVGINISLDNPFESTFDLNIDEVNANNNVNAAIEMINKNTIEIVSVGNELITKVSDNDFASYKIQNSNEIKDTVKDINNNIEATRKTLANEISDKVGSKDFESYKKQTEESIEQTVTNSKEYINSRLKQTAQGFESEVGNLNDKNSELAKSINSINEDLKTQIENSVTGINNNISEITQEWNSNISELNSNISINSDNLKSFASKSIQAQNGFKQSVENLNKDIESTRTQLATEIADKVSSKDFQSYKVQTQNSLVNVVNDAKKNISAVKEQLSDEISNKISSKDAESIFKQNLNEFDFTIGENTPLQITKDTLKCEFNDKSEIMLSKDGFYYQTGDQKFSYHSLYVHDSIMKIRSGKAGTILIPDIFKGKNYKIGYWLGNTFPDHEGDLICSQGVELVENVKDSHFKVKVNLLMRNPDIERAPNWKGSANIVYTILA